MPRLKGGPWETGSESKGSKFNGPEAGTCCKVLLTGPDVFPALQAMGCLLQLLGFALVAPKQHQSK
jgi:hypothetical protein